MPPRIFSLAALALIFVPAASLADVTAAYNLSLLPTGSRNAQPPACQYTDSTYQTPHTLPIDLPPLFSLSGNFSRSFRLTASAPSDPYLVSQWDAFQINQSGANDASFTASKGKGVEVVFSYSQTCQFAPAKILTLKTGGIQFSGSFSCLETEIVNVPDSGAATHGFSIPGTTGTFVQVVTPQSGYLFYATLSMTSGSCQAAYIVTGTPD